MTPDSALEAPPLSPAQTAPPATPTDIQITRRIACPPERVWRAIIDPEESAVWLAEMIVEPAVGGRFQAGWHDGDCATGRVLAWEPHTRLATTWHWQRVGGETTFALDLQPDCDGRVTIVTLTHSGTDDSERRDYELGWAYYAARLVDLCEENGVRLPKLSDYPTAIEVAIELGAPRERVWAALTRDEELDRWFTRAHVEPWVGGAAQFYGMRTGRLIEGGRLTEYEPPSRLALTWAEPGWPGETTVTITLSDTRAGTRLTLTHGGWDSLPLPMAHAERYAKTCWRDALADLRAYLTLSRVSVPSDGFRRTHAIPASAAHVWELLTRAEHVSRWVTMPDRALATAAIEPVVGGEVRLEFPEGDALLGRVTKAEPPTHMTWAVRAAGFGPEATIAFEVTPEASGEVLGVRLACTGRGFELETERRAFDRRASLWLMQIYELATGEDPTRIERTRSDPIELAIDLPTDPLHVFTALTRHENVTAWMCDRAEMETVVGGAVTFETQVAEDRAIIETGRVIEYRAGERLAYALEEMGAGWGAPLVAAFDLRSVAGKTRLRLSVTGWDDLPLPLRDATRAQYATLWRQRLAALRDSPAKATDAAPAPARPRAEEQRYGAETRGRVKPKRAVSSDAPRPRAKTTRGKKQT